MALFQRLTSVLPILDGLRTARVITEQEHSVITQKAQTSLQARLLIDAVLVKGSFAVTVFKNCLLEMDPVLYERFFGECCTVIWGIFLSQLKIRSSCDKHWVSYVNQC